MMLHAAAVSVTPGHELKGLLGVFPIALVRRSLDEVGKIPQGHVLSMAKRSQGCLLALWFFCAPGHPGFRCSPCLQKK